MKEFLEKIGLIDHLTATIVVDNAANYTFTWSTGASITNSNRCYTIRITTCRIRFLKRCYWCYTIAIIG